MGKTPGRHEIRLDPTGLLGEVVVTGYSFHRSRGAFSVITVIRTNTLFDTIRPLLSKFTVYPNPAKQGQPVTIANKKLPEDVYAAEFINLAGQSINRRQLFIGSKDRISLQLPVTTAGVYYLKLTGSKSAKVYTEKIIVQ